jgi:hypothetical protein
METVASAITILMVLRVTAANVLRVQDSVFIACVQCCKKSIFYDGKTDFGTAVGNDITEP